MQFSLLFDAVTFLALAIVSDLVEAEVTLYATCT